MNLCNKFEISPLWVACKNGHKSAAQILLQKGAKVNKRDSRGTSPISVACENGHGRIVQLLLEYNAEVNERDLLAAYKNGYSSIDKLLLEKNAKVNEYDTHGITPICTASGN